MTVAETLLVLARTGCELVVLVHDTGPELRLRFGRGIADEAQRARVRAAVGAHKEAIVALATRSAVEAAFGLPAELPLPPALLTVLAAFTAQRRAFGEDESELFEERAAMRELAGMPRWFAEVIAVEDVLVRRAVPGSSSPSAARRSA